MRGRDLAHARADRGGGRLTTAPAGQFVVRRLRPAADGPVLFRSYSLSGPLADEHYRISIKVEPHGVAAALCDGHPDATPATASMSASRGEFHLTVA